MSAVAPVRVDDPLELPVDLALRAMTETDLPFLERVYASTRTVELAQTDWSEAQKADFLAFQFHAQHQHYQTHYHDAQFYVDEREAIPIGRLYLH